MKKIDIQAERRGPFHNIFRTGLYENMNDNFITARGHTEGIHGGIWNTLADFQMYFFNSLWFLQRQTFGMDLSGSEWFDAI